MVDLNNGFQRGSGEMPKDGTLLLTWDDLTCWQLTFWDEYRDPCSDEDDTLIVGWTDGILPTVWDGNEPDAWWYLPKNPMKVTEE